MLCRRSPVPAVASYPPVTFDGERDRDGRRAFVVNIELTAVTHAVDRVEQTRACHMKLVVFLALTIKEGVYVFHDE